MNPLKPSIYLCLFLLVACSNPQAKPVSSKMSDTAPKVLENYNPILKFSLRKGSDKELPQKIEVSLDELRKNLSLSQFEVSQHPVYKRAVQYEGFYFDDILNFIFKKLKSKNSSEYVYSIWSSDNFSAFIDSDDLKTGRAFLATRELFTELTPANPSPDGLWTMIEKHGNPGPFYLVWNNPEKTYWQKWPFKVAEITFVSKDITKKFKKLEPDDDFMRTKGFRLVLKNCVSCHMVNHVGFAQMGPDLKVLAQIRNVSEFTKQIRQPSGRMIPFSPNVLSDDDIGSIYSYLTYLGVKKK